MAAPHHLRRGRHLRCGDTARVGSGANDRGRRGPRTTQPCQAALSALLDAHGVSPRVNLPGVGRNLQDHLQIRSAYRLKDGTVTLNDAAGHAANLFASDASPTHAGVWQLVSELHARGYALIFLTSRPLLGTAGIERTRRFLFDVAVDTPSGARMPPAPVITTTHRDMFGALADELSGKSRAFKAGALKPLRDAFAPPARTLARGSRWRCCL